MGVSNLPWTRARRRYHQRRCEPKCDHEEEQAPVLSLSLCRVSTVEINRPKQVQRRQEGEDPLEEDEEAAMSIGRAVLRVRLLVTLPCTEHLSRREGLRNDEPHKERIHQVDDGRDVEDDDEASCKADN